MSGIAKKCQNARLICPVGGLQPKDHTRKRTKSISRQCESAFRLAISPLCMQTACKEKKKKEKRKKRKKVLLTQEWAKRFDDDRQEMTPVACVILFCGARLSEK